MSTLWIVRRWIGDCTCGVTVRCTTLFKMLLERPEHRTLHCKIGIPVLDVLVGHLALGPSLVAFMKEKRPETERLSVITRDEWAQMLPFLLKYQTEPLSRYSDGDAWPVILDEFVEWHNANTLTSKPPQNVKPTDP